MGPFFEKKVSKFGNFLSWFQDHKLKLQVGWQGVGKRLIAHFVAQMYSLGISVQLKEGSGGHFWDMGFTIKKFTRKFNFWPLKFYSRFFSTYGQISQKSVPDAFLGWTKTPNGTFSPIIWALNHRLTRRSLVCRSIFWKNLVIFFKILVYVWVQ